MDMKVKEGFVVRKIGKQYMAVPVGGRTRDFAGVITLNETGAFLWEKLENDTTKEDLLKAMLDEYEVTEDIAKKDIDNFITKLKDGNLLE